MVKKVMGLLILVNIIISLCYADPKISYFDIGVGDKATQLGYQSGEEGENDGPTSLAIYKDNIYILDDVNLKVNIYSKLGVYKKTVRLPKTQGFYNDLAVTSFGKILILSDNGIFELIKDKTLKKMFEIPNNISVPYYIKNDNFGNIVFAGLAQPGENQGMVSGIYNKTGFNDLGACYPILISKNGLIGIKIDPNTMKILKNNKPISTIALTEDAVPFGLSDDCIVYCAERNRNIFQFYKVDSKSKSRSVNVAFSSSVLVNESLAIKSFRITDNNEIVCLDSNEKRCRVLSFKI